MSEIFEEDPQVTMFQGGTIRPRAKNLPMIYKGINTGGVKAALWITVIGMCNYDRSDPTSIAVRKDFTAFDSGQAVLIPAESEAAGKIYFLVRLTYYMMGGKAGNLGTSGLVNYTCSFDYDFKQDTGDGLGADDMILQNPVQIKQDYEVHEGADDAEITLSNFTPTVGLPGGPKYIRITPVLSVAGAASPVNIGSFTLSLHVIEKPAEALPEDFVQDMLLWLWYEEAETKYTRARQQAVLTWAANINRKYSLLAEAVRGGSAPLLHVNGYASKTGNSLDNQKYGDGRVAPVTQDVAKLLAVPANKISPKSFGDQEAIWHWDFDTNGGAQKGPRAEDRRVAVWFEPRAAWKAMHASK